MLNKVEAYVSSEAMLNTVEAYEGSAAMLNSVELKHVTRSF
jgi:hypothetical protein